MAKYSGGGAPPPPKKPPAERVLLSSPAKAHIDAPLTIGEQRAKAIAVGRAIGRVSAALTAAQAAAVAARDRATGAAAAPRKVRSVASARAAREQMEKEALPAALGGLAVEEEPPDEPELTTVDEEQGGDDAEAGAASSSTGLPALCEVWSAKCEELYDDSRVFCVRLSQCGAPSSLLGAAMGRSAPSTRALAAPRTYSTTRRLIRTRRRTQRCDCLRPAYDGVQAVLSSSQTLLARSSDGRRARRRSVWRLSRRRATRFMRSTAHWTAGSSRRPARIRPFAFTTNRVWSW